jgi:hypothetical protein
LQYLGTLSGAGHFGDAQAEVAIDDNDFSASHETPGYQEFGGFTYSLVQFHDDPGRQPEDFPKKHFALTEANRGLQFDVEK